MQTSSESPNLNQDRIIKALEKLPDIPKRGFTDFEIRTIKKYVPLKGISAVAKILGKTVSQVKNKWYLIRNG